MVCGAWTSPDAGHILTRCVAAIGPWTVVALSFGGLIFAVSRAVLGMMRVRGWRAWMGSVVLSAGASVATSGILAITDRAPFQPAAPAVKQWVPSKPAGPFASLSSRAVRGWYWIHGGEHWREALVLQPPCRVVGNVALPAGQPLRLFFAVSTPKDRAKDASIRVRCSVLDGEGRETARWDRALPASDGVEEFGPWSALSLNLSSALGPGAQVVLEVDGPDREGSSKGLPLLAVAVPPKAPSVPPVPGPNCVIILVDTLRPDRLHCYGFPLETSPYIDQLAAQGTLFEDVVSAASWTVPAVASLFTGTHVSTHGMARLRIPGRLSFPALAEQCREIGVRTAAVSSNCALTPAGGFGAGFEEFVGLDSGESGGGHERYLRANWVTDHAISLLSQLNGQRFFLYLHYMDPHDPYDPPQTSALFGASEQGRYLGEIRYCDGEIGRLLAGLDALGRTPDTLVILVADHGEAFMEHGFVHHGNTVHREEVQVPLILRLPGTAPAGRRVSSRVRSIDAHATIAELMGLPALRHAEGESLTPLLRDGEIAAHRTAFSEILAPIDDAQQPQVAFYRGDYKLILEPGTGRRLLYQVRSDPDEGTDLAAGQSASADSMERQIRRFLQERRGRVTPPQALTPAEKQQLKRLGYLAGETH